MNHQRHLIREGLVALLAAGGTAAGARVFDHATRPITQFPALDVTDRGEAQRAQSMPANATRPIERRLLIEVAAKVQELEGYVRSRDQLLADVERLFAGAVAAGSVTGVKAITPAGFEPDTEGTHELPIAVGRQRFEVLYYTPQGDPSTHL